MTRLLRWQVRLWELEWQVATLEMLLSRPRFWARAATVMLLESEKERGGRDG